MDNETKGNDVDANALDKFKHYDISDADEKKIENAFTYHAPKGDQADRYVNIRTVARVLAQTMCTLAPPSRELSLALTNLEQAVMWANAAIARNE